MLRITKTAEAAIDNCLAHFLTDELIYRVSDDGQILAIFSKLDEPSAPSDNPADFELLFTIVYDEPSIRLVAGSELHLFNLCREFCIEHEWDLNIERARCEILKILDCMRWLPGSREEVAQVFASRS